MHGLRHLLFGLPARPSVGHRQRQRDTVWGVKQVAGLLGKQAVQVERKGGVTADQFCQRVLAYCRANLPWLGRDQEGVFIQRFLHRGKFNRGTVRGYDRRGSAGTQYQQRRQYQQQSVLPQFHLSYSS